MAESKKNASLSVKKKETLLKNAKRRLVAIAPDEEQVLYEWLKNKYEK